MKKIFLALSISFLLSGCQSFFQKTEKVEEPIKNQNIDFQVSTLNENYFNYVNTLELVNMPPISEELKSYLLEQISKNTTQIREVVESKEKFEDKMKDATCGDLPKKLCEYNAYLYSGSYFGLKLYEKANSQELLNNSIVVAPLSMWSVNWLKQSYARGLDVAKQCPSAENDCLNKYAKNPIEKLVGLCQAGASDQLNQCIGLVLNKPENKDFAFMLGYITGYNISFNVGNGMK